MKKVKRIFVLALTVIKRVIAVLDFMKDIDDFITFAKARLKLPSPRNFERRTGRLEQPRRSSHQLAFSSKTNGSSEKPKGILEEPFLFSSAHFHFPVDELRFCI